MIGEQFSRKQMTKQKIVEKNFKLNFVSELNFFFSRNGLKLKKKLNRLIDTIDFFSKLSIPETN